jgi:hypothetical protein
LGQEGVERKKEEKGRDSTILEYICTRYLTGETPQEFDPMNSNKTLSKCAARE